MLCVRFPRDPRACSHARALTGQVLTIWRPEADIEAARTIVSELVQNAVRHTASRLVTLTVRDTRRGVLLEVGDDDPTPIRFPARSDAPSPADASQLAEEGRGLAVVAALADCAGCRPYPRPGKTCWALLR